MNHIIVAYATLDDYEYMAISMISVLRSANIDTYYDFIVLLDNTVESKIVDKLHNCLKEYGNYSITFYNVGSVFDGIESSVDFIKNATFFRLVLPQLVLEDKCIYLDSDTIVCTDLLELYNSITNDYYVAGVKGPWYHTQAPTKEYCRMAMLPGLDQYINAGVLILNLEKLRRDKVDQELVGLLSYKFPTQDQDIINKVCYGKIMHLPFKYNVMTKYAFWNEKDYGGIFTHEEIKEAWNQPAIIHYADRDKPWNCISGVFHDCWWNVCRTSYLWKYFYLKLEDVFFERAVYHSEKATNGITNKLVPLEKDLVQKENIAVFGAGERGKYFIKYLLSRDIRPLYIVVTNKNKNPTQIEGIKVIGLDELGGNNENITVYIATVERTHAVILSELLPLRFREIIPLSDRFVE